MDDFRKYFRYLSLASSLVPNILAVVSALEQHGVKEEDIPDLIAQGIRGGLDDVVEALTHEAGQ
jgi:hypothetical protein